MKKILKDLLTLFLIMLLVTPVNIMATESNQKEKSIVDITPPTLENVSIDKKSVKAGETVTYTIKAKDDSSGMKYVSMNLKMPQSNKSMFAKFEISDNGDYVYRLYTDQETENGKWMISSISLQDNKDNTLVIHNENLWSHVENRTDLSHCDFVLSGSDNADITPPTFEGVNIDKKVLKAGETVTYTIKAKDDSSGMKYVSMNLKMPQSNKSMFAKFEISDNGDYVYRLYTDQETENGKWIISSISLQDNKDNTLVIYNENLWSHVENRTDLSHCDFVLSGSDNADITPPTFEGVNIDKKVLKAGETVTYTIKAKDDKSGIKAISMNLRMPQSNKNKFVIFEKNDNDDYVYTQYTDQETENGKWMISSIFLDDNKDNELIIYNENLWSYVENKIDLSHCDFNLEEDSSSIQPLENVTIISKNRDVYNETFKGDVYIAEDAVVNFYNCTVNGNVYILGALYSNSSYIYGTVNCISAIYGSVSTLYPGTLVVRGSGYIYSTSASNRPVKELPIRFDGNLIVNKNGEITLQGATVPLSDLIINDKKVDLDYRGRFDVKNFYVGESDKLIIKRNIGLGYTITQEIEVNHEKPERLEIVKNPDKTKYIYGESFDKKGMQVNAIYKDGTVKDISEIVEVGEMAGTGDIDVELSYRGVSVTLKVNVKTISADSITLDNNNKVVEVKNSFNLIATITPENTTNKDVVWESSNKSIATVDDSGKVTGISKGEATITAKTANGKTAICKVIVKSPIESVTLSKNAINLEIDEKDALKATINPDDVINKKLKWSSSNTDVATVDDKGNITAISKGKTTITVTTVNGKVATCNVQIYPKALSINVEKLNEKMNIGEKKQLNAAIVPNDVLYKELIWTSSNSKVAEVDNKGNVKAIKAGITKITVSLKSNLKIKTTIDLKVVLEEGWNQKENGEWEYYRKGNQIDGWQAIDGLQYYFRNKEMVHDWFLDEKTQTWYFFLGGVMQRTDITINDITYKFDSDGIWRGYQPRWVWENNNYYYRDEWNNSLKGWQAINGLQYKFREDGTMIRDWYLDEKTKTWYFFNGGVMQRTNIVINGKVNVFDNYGIWRGIQ